ncbi:hypothetical protein F0562_030830 [Nyssa sinensis]|uniref:Uncharacterized protein n=1 Tax=Nyssa sinensis TaxID=561372 RepID=A0A5J5AZX5_9ASTE|nr:hypothetical protein F0562_030830 [Nyssa sinensis]
MGADDGAVAGEELVEHQVVCTKEKCKAAVRSWCGGSGQLKRTTVRNKLEQQGNVIRMYACVAVDRVRKEESRAAGTIVAKFAAAVRIAAVLQQGVGKIERVRR